MTRISSAIIAAALAALIAIPAGAQVPIPGVPVPDVPVDVPDLPVDIADLPLEIPELPPLLDLTSPLLDQVSGVVDGLAGQITDSLVDVPLVNILSLQGDDAIDAAVAFSQATFESSNVAILARDDIFADSLTTGALQGIFNAPMLLTDSGDLDSRTARELVRLGVDTLYILGADDAIHPLVAQKLEIAGLDVTRLGGTTRVETAVEAAQAAAPTATTAVLTRAYASAGGDDSQAYADLLGVSPWAAENDWPVLLTQTSSLTPSVGAYLAGSTIREVVIVGGPEAVSAATEQAVQALGISTRRVSGSNRFATAVAIAGERGFATSGDTDRVILAEGGAARSDVWAPGFAGAAHGAQHRAPILLTSGDEIPMETLAFITGGLQQNILDGGPALLCASFVSPIACQAAGLLMLGDLTAALNLLNLPLGALPGIEDILGIVETITGIALELPDVTETVAGVLEDPLGTVTDAVEGAVGTATGAVEGAVDTVTDTASGATGGATDPATDAVTGATDTVTDTVTGTTGGTTGGATGAAGGATGTVTGTVTGALGG